MVIHCTELPDLATAREYGERVLYAESGTGNSGHYYIDRDGRCHRYVAPDRIAHHVRGYNPRSIGIELVNSGRYPHWLDSRHQAMDEPYPDAQIDALIALLQRVAGGAAGVALHRRARRPRYRDGAGQRRSGDPGAAQARSRGRCSRGSGCWRQVALQRL